MKKYITRLTFSRLFPLSVAALALLLFFSFVTADTPAEKYQKAQERCEDSIWVVRFSSEYSSPRIGEIQKHHKPTEVSLEDAWRFTCSREEALKISRETAQTSYSLAFILFPPIFIGIEGIGMLWWVYEEVRNMRTRR